MLPNCCKENVWLVLWVIFLNRKTQQTSMIPTIQYYDMYAIVIPWAGVLCLISRHTVVFHAAQEASAPDHNYIDRKKKRT